MAVDVPTDREAEVATTLAGPTPRTLGFLDQGAFWVNLGVSLLGFSGAATVLSPSGGPPLPFLAAVLAAVLGTVVGSVMLGLSAVPGARTQQPSMVQWSAGACAGAVGGVGACACSRVELFGNGKATVSVMTQGMSSNEVAAGDQAAPGGLRVGVGDPLTQRGELHQR